MKNVSVLFTFLTVLLWSTFCVAAELKPSVIPEDEEGIAGEEDQISDPLEKFNRAMFTFNDKVYYYVLKPTAQGYKAVVPEQARIGVRKVFTNVAMPIRFTNCVLQGKLKGAGVEASRFVINTTVGILGLFDPAKSYCKMNPYDEDFDQTLGYYCMEPGFFIVWPFLGPSSARGILGTAGDYLVDPLTYLLPEWPDYLGVRIYQVVNQTSLTIGDYEDLTKAAIDPYVALRNAYFQYRKNKVAK
jgi:phospholipid-binding lipoprotein MlaA